jgi:hypothetical protein
MSGCQDRAVNWDDVHRHSDECEVWASGKRDPANAHSAVGSASRATRKRRPAPSDGPGLLHSLRSRVGRGRYAASEPRTGIKRVPLSRRRDAHQTMSVRGTPGEVLSGDARGWGRNRLTFLALPQITPARAPSRSDQNESRNDKAKKVRHSGSERRKSHD